MNFSLEPLSITVCVWTFSKTSAITKGATFLFLLNTMILHYYLEHLKVDLPFHINMELHVFHVITLNLELHDKINLCPVNILKFPSLFNFLKTQGLKSINIDTFCLNLTKILIENWLVDCYKKQSQNINNFGQQELVIHSPVGGVTSGIERKDCGPFRKPGLHALPSFSKFMASFVRRRFNGKQTGNGHFSS